MLPLVSVSDVFFFVIIFKHNIRNEELYVEVSSKKYTHQNRSIYEDTGFTNSAILPPVSILTY